MDNSFLQKYFTLESYEVESLLLSLNRPIERSALSVLEIPDAGIISVNPAYNTSFYSPFTFKNKKILVLKNRR